MQHAFRPKNALELMIYISLIGVIEDFDRQKKMPAVISGESMFMNRLFCRIFAVLFVALLSSQAATANIKNSEKKNELIITKWTTREGLPQNTVTSILQTRDGYIWIATFGGLARFDGLKFTIFDAANSSAFTETRITSLYEDRFGTLWIGTEPGSIFTLRNGVFSRLESKDETARDTITAFQEDSDGNFYVCSYKGAERFTFDGGGNIALDTGVSLTEKPCRGLNKDRDQNVWIFELDKFFIVIGDKLFELAEKNIHLPEETEKIGFADDGKILAGGSQTLTVSDGEQQREILPRPAERSFYYFSIAFNKGEFWFQEKDYLLEISALGETRHDLQNYVADGSRVMFFDREDNLWIGTNRDGLLRVKKRKIELLSDLTNSAISGTYSVVQDLTGTIWVGGNSALFRIENGEVQQFTRLSGVGQYKTIRSLAVDGDNRLWIGSDDGAARFENGAFVEDPAFAGQKLNALFFDKDRNLWAAGNDGVFFRSHDEAVRRYRTEDGLIDNRVSYITQTRDGRIWIGTNKGLSIFSNGQFENFGESNGLSAGKVRDVLEDQDGMIWIGSYGGGIIRYRNGSFISITKDQGLHDNFVSRILPDKFGRFWVLTNHGILKLDRAELNDVADGKKKTLVNGVYATAGELEYGEGSGGHEPAGLMARDGKVWFPMIEDMVIIDTNTPDEVAPVAIIERATTKAGDPGKQQLPTISAPSLIKIENGLRNLEIEYTGLSFTKPEEMIFFYKMDGLDDDWVSAGTRRTAFFPYLPPGEYVFQVRAVSVSGVWSSNTASIKISVAKKFWETWWFSLLIAATVFAALILTYRLRLKKLEEQQRRQKDFSKRLIGAYESERRRIAVELHDGLGQILAVIKNRAVLGLMRGDDSQETSKALNIVSDSAAQAIEEIREITNNLRPRLIDRLGLTRAIGSMVKKLSDVIEIQREIDLIDGIFNETEEISIYRIIQESLNNVIKHSDASHAVVKIKKDAKKVSISIADDGRGFDVEKIKATGGLGLVGLSERAQLLNADLRIDSQIGEGTLVEIKIPLTDDEDL